ncbi:dienelactone hydrolase [Bradyrhizobium sp. CCGUVB1N3]|uniref:alpha/beta hydrolase family protein n=1 Tax=Bradyrhizobium sp. CCGUVB1N3 TaxID=2949629 RepID=UPI0020B1B30D|nr:dienelactone hydrolase [Bradyrhizobium sp. CCGUVB1N3]MCP3476773.1 dienelactone hydrolase [Bradyrhizobium sp. CCGUVB1N3]
MNADHAAFQFASSSWTLRLDREDLQAEVNRIFVAAQEGGATLAECSATLGCIDFSDDQSWHSHWWRIGDISEQRGNAAFRDGHAQTAWSNWLRALNYYQAAAFPFEATDQRHEAAIARMRQCAMNYVRHARLPGEVVSIGWSGRYPLEGYFLPASADAARGPVVVCFGEPEQRKEQCLYKLVPHALSRGLSLLIVDLHGAGPTSRFGEAVARGNLETAIGAVADYVFGRPDVDADRVAIVADDWSSSFVARGAVLDGRFAAAVCDCGLWEMHEMEFMRGRLGPPQNGEFFDPIISRTARNLKCPVLVTAGERGWLQTERIRELSAGLVARGRDITLRIFTAEETGAEQAHADNPTLSNEHIFDWLSDRLGTSTRSIFRPPG